MVPDGQKVLVPKKAPSHYLYSYPVRLFCCEPPSNTKLCMGKQSKDFQKTAHLCLGLRVVQINKQYNPT